MQKNKKRDLITFCLWGFLLILVVLYSLFGFMDWTFPYAQTLVLEVRLPRVLLALLSGMGLTLAGCLFQLILNNPLADSFTLGLANGTTLGAAVTVFLGLSFIWIAPIAILFGLISLMIVIFVAQIISKGYPTRMLILSGIMIGAMMNACLYLLVQFNPRKLQNILNYMFGGFAAAEMREVLLIGSSLILALVLVGGLLPQLKLLQLNVLSSQSLGVKTERLSMVTLVIATGLSATIIGYVGVIGFIGIVIPQLVHRITFGGLETKIVFNLLIGGTVMVFADSLGSQLFAPIQLPASIVLAILGIPFMFYLMWMENQKRHHV